MKPHPILMPSIPKVNAQTYERYLPTAFDESMTLLEKTNKVIETSNKLVETFDGFNKEWERYGKEVADYIEAYEELIKLSQTDFVAFWNNFVKDVENGIINWLNPVETFDDLSTTYPNATNGDASMTIDSGFVYRFNGDEWVKFQKVDATPIANLSKRVDELGVSYSQFGAKLDGVTDDSLAIKATHEYANQYGLPVVQRNSQFVLNMEVEVKTSTDLSGSTLITSANDTQSVEYNRTFNLFKITGNPLEDISTMVNQSQFSKGATRIASLANIDGGLLVIKTSELDLVRQDGGNRSNVVKQEANILMRNVNGDLLYPLTKNYTGSSSFQVFIRKDQDKLIFKAPQVVLRNANIYSIAKCYRNNVEFSDVIIVDENPTSEISPLYTICEFEDCSRIRVKNTTCPIIGRPTKTGVYGLGYLYLFTRCANIEVDGIFQITGWSGVNGNWFRDVTITNSKLITIGGHVNTFDMKVDNCLVYKEIIAHGGGLLDIKNTTVDGRNYSNAIETRLDYAGEWDGTINIENVRTLYSRNLLVLNSVGYDCGRKVVLPKVVLKNVTMENRGSYETKLIDWKGFAGNFDAVLPSFKIDGAEVDNKGQIHRTLEIQQTLSNTFLNGVIEVEVSRAKVNRSSFDTSVFDAWRSNFIIPIITNANVLLNMNIEKSLANFQVYSTSQTNIKVKDSDVYIFRQQGGPNAITYVGSPLKADFDSCVFHRPYCDIASYAGGVDRCKFTIVNSRYVRFLKKDGTYDNLIGFTIENLIVYAKNNVAESAGSLPLENANRLFDYIDPTYWKTS